MDIYASDEEKGEQIKQWWRDNGTSVLIGFAVVLAIVFGVRYWFNYQQSVAASASMLYQSVISNISQDKLAEADASTKILITEYPRSAYAVFSSLEMAEKMAANETSNSRSYYQWVLDHATLPGHIELARLRLAKLLYSNADYDDALTLVEQAKSVPFVSLFLELKGDIYVAKQDTAQAHAAYQAALSQLERNAPRQQVLQIKLDDTALNNDA